MQNAARREGILTIARNWLLPIVARNRSSMIIVGNRSEIYCEIALSISDGIRCR